MTTFITFFYDIEGICSFHTYIERFEILAKTGIKIIAAIDDGYLSRSKGYLEPYLNVILIPGGTIETIRKYFGLSKEDNGLILPSYRNHDKDTLEYFLTMNYKTVMIQKLLPVIATPNVAWIDFGIAKIFKQPNCLARLSEIAPLSMNKITIAGSHMYPEPVNIGLSTQVWWRFLGGLFVGSCVSMKNFAVKAEEEFRNFLAAGRATWEVNIWARVEWKNRNLIDWYPADHDDTILTHLVQINK
jgi:hypothetical protein